MNSTVRSRSGVLALSSISTCLVQTSPPFSPYVCLLFSSFLPSFYLVSFGNFGRVNLVTVVSKLSPFLPLVSSEVLHHLNLIYLCCQLPPEDRKANRRSSRSKSPTRGWFPSLQVARGKTWLCYYPRLPPRPLPSPLPPLLPSSPPYLSPHVFFF